MAELMRHAVERMERLYRLRLQEEDAVKLELGMVTKALEERLSRKAQLEEALGRYLDRLRRVKEEADVSSIADCAAYVDSLRKKIEMEEESIRALSARRREVVERLEAASARRKLLEDVVGRLSDSLRREEEKRLQKKIDEVAVERALRGEVRP